MTGQSKLLFVYKTIQKVIVIPPDSSQKASTSSKSSTEYNLYLVVDNEVEIESPWFKDEGGKGKQMEMVIRAVNSKGETELKAKGMKLLYFLRYANGEVPVELDGDEPLFTYSSNQIVDETGQCRIMFRIGQVSSRHEGKKFCVWVVPDPSQPSDLNERTRPTHSPFIKVKSKISTKNRIARGLRVTANKRSATAAYDDNDDDDADAVSVKKQRVQQLQNENKRLKNLIQKITREREYHKHQFECKKEECDELLDKNAMQERELAQRKQHEDFNVSILTEYHYRGEFEMSSLEEGGWLAQPFTGGEHEAVLAAEE